MRLRRILIDSSSPRQKLTWGDPAFFIFVWIPAFAGMTILFCCSGKKTAAPIFQGRRLSVRQLGLAILQVVATSVSPIGTVAVSFQPQPVFSSSNFMSPVIGVSAEM